MIGSHPGGIGLTQRLFGLAEGECLVKGVDLGAGDGTSVRYLREKGYQVTGVDNQEFDGEAVIWGDMTAMDVLEGSLWRWKERSFRGVSGASARGKSFVVRCVFS